MCVRERDRGMGTGLKERMREMAREREQKTEEKKTPINKKHKYCISDNIIY